MYRESEKEAARGMNAGETECSRAPLASLCLLRRAAADLRSPNVKRARQTNLQSKWQSQIAAELPASRDLITFSHRFHFVFSSKATAVIMQVECTQVEPISEPWSRFSSKQLRLLVPAVWTLSYLSGDEWRSAAAGGLWWSENELCLTLISQILDKAQPV